MTEPAFQLSEQDHALLPSAQEVEFYQAHGWYLSKKLLTDEEVDLLDAAADRFYAGHRDRTLPVRPPRLAYWEPSRGDVHRHNDYIFYEDDTVRRILSKPVIAAVAGHAVAGGLELALWCDLRVAEENAVFGVFCRRWGVPLIDGGTVRLPQLIGAGRAMDLILTGRAVYADEAMDMGLVNRLVPEGMARKAAEQLAREIAGLPQVCLRSDRASALDGLSLSHDEAMAGEFRAGMATLADPAVVVGISRFRGGAGRGGAPA